MIILDKFLSFFAPFECIQCGLEDNLLCIKCRHYFMPSQAICFYCRQVLRQNKFCSCFRHEHLINRLYFVSSYNGIAKKIVLSLKSSGRVGIAQLMADIMAQNILNTNNLIVTHIPTASKRIRLRGFDHSALLAREISKKLNIPYIKFLLKNNQSQQVGSSKEQRQKNMKNAFLIQNKGILKGANILIVDDVLTTGVTIEVAAKELLSSGAKNVDAVVFAIALKRIG